MKLIQAEVSGEKEYLKNLSFDPAPIIEVVKKIIDKWDPLNLWALECPDDEYEAEIRKISIYITKHRDNLNVTTLEQQIIEIFELSFDEELARDKSSMSTSSAIYTALHCLLKDTQK